MMFAEYITGKEAFIMAIMGFVGGYLTCAIELDDLKEKNKKLEKKIKVEKENKVKENNDNNVLDVSFRDIV